MQNYTCKYKEFGVFCFCFLELMEIRGSTLEHSNQNENKNVITKSMSLSMNSLLQTLLNGFASNVSNATLKLACAGERHY